MRRLVAASRYEDARALSAIKHTYLYSSLTELIRERQREMGSTASSTAMWIAGSGEALGSAAADAGPLSQRVKRELKRPANYLGLLLIFLVGSVVFRVALIQPNEIEMLSTQELSQIASFISSGYRGDSGSGSLFIGTVNQQWYRLNDEDQISESLELAKELGYGGVEEVMLFDTRHALVLHLVGDQIRHPAQPPAPASE